MRVIMKDHKSNPKKKPFFKKGPSRSFHPKEVQKRSSPSIRRALPNMVTLLSLCMGLSSIPFGFQGEWHAAMTSVLIAGLLDGLDGPLARLLNSSTDFGAELDSLADFINFGAAPAVLIYFFALHQWGRFGWGICLFFAACSALRLARFNIHRTDPEQKNQPRYFSVGVPATIGALLALIPMIYSFIFNEIIVMFHAFMLIVTGVFMISRYPTFVLKGVRVPPQYVGLAGAIAIVVLILGLLFPWESLLGLGILYMLSWPISLYWFHKNKKNTLLSAPE